MNELEALLRACACIGARVRLTPVNGSLGTPLCLELVVDLLEGAPITQVVQPRYDFADASAAATVRALCALRDHLKQRCSAYDQALGIVVHTLEDDDAPKETG